MKRDLPDYLRNTEHTFQVDWSRPPSDLAAAVGGLGGPQTSDTGPDDVPQRPVPPCQIGLRSVVESSQSFAGAAPVTAWLPGMSRR